MRRLVIALAECLDEAVAVQERLLERLRAQRVAIVAGDAARVEESSLRMEEDVLRLGGIESTRNRIAAELADELGVVVSRWSALREALTENERRALAPRVTQVERLVRDLELQNTINGQLVRTELALVDTSVRSLGNGGRRAVTRAYAPGGATPAPPAATPVLLNLAA
ncbi:MAG TPA: flagellar export chaperone FlgN [Miltoncostaeaceae bacterium]|nr:flagellar export chaperone FlgN [Miltoncostaeaceae bacterium]